MAAFFESFAYADAAYLNLLIAIMRYISPVIATSRFTGIPDNADIIAVAIVIPADGPSLGVAPSGMCI